MHFLLTSSNGSWYSITEFCYGRILLTNTLPSFPFPMLPVAPVDLRVGTVSSNVYLGSLCNNLWLKIWTHGTCANVTLYPYNGCNQNNFSSAKYPTLYENFYHSSTMSVSLKAALQVRGVWVLAIQDSAESVRNSKDLPRSHASDLALFYKAELFSGFPVGLGSLINVFKFQIFHLNFSLKILFFCGNFFF